ncbi:MAG TPA: c-type cytochrome [Aquabacterium sp.]|nr:c-type cytochrome [Aquabacterium sp.]
MKTLSNVALQLSMATLVGLWGASSALAQDVKPGDPNAAKGKIAMCLGCHGIVGYRSSFPEIHRVPMISGQSAKYIESALHAYQKGDRKHPTMRGIATSLTDQDIADIAAYYSQSGKDLPPTKPQPTSHTAEAEALVKKGNCLACHGEGLNKPIDPSYPKLAGQYSDYVYVALKSYQTDNNARIGRSNPIMGAQAKLFTLPELKILAEYVGSLQGDLRTVPESPIHKP